MERLPKFNKSIKTTIIFAFLIPVILLILSFGLFFYFIAKKTMDDEMGRRLLTIANISSIEAKDWGFTTLSPGDENSRTYTAIVSKLRKLRDNSSVKKIYVFDANNQSLADSDGDIPLGTTYFNHALHTNELNLVKSGKATASVLFKGEDGNYYKSGFAPVFGFNNDIIGFIGVEGSAQFFQSLNRLKKNILVFILIGIILTTIIGITISGKIVYPINTLVNTAKEIGEGNMKGEIKIKSRDEIGFLAYSINEMKKNIIERDNRLKTMMQGIAHEVRNPLGGIELFSGLLKEELSYDKEKLQYVEKIQTEIKNLKSLVEEFLDFARSVKPIPTPVQMKDFAEDLKLNFLSELENNDIDFKISVSGKNKTFYFDPDQMKRALLNIIRNAMDATPKGGKIEFLCSHSNGQGIISIKDSGKGIDDEIADKIFEPFFTTKDTGSGLGLSFAKKIVNSHNGEIDISSSVGKGTTVTIILPKFNQVESV